MTAFFEFALSGFWTFLGVVFLAGLMGRLAIYLVIGVIAAARGHSVRLGGGTMPTSGKIIKAVRNALDDGKLDAPIARAMRRNADRRGQL